MTLAAKKRYSRAETQGRRERSNLKNAFPLRLCVSARVNLVLLLLASLSLSACGSKQDIVHISGPTMGTTYHVSIAPGEQMIPKQLSKDIANVLDAINQSMSTYLPDSEINRFNTHPLNKPFSASKDFFQVALDARAVYLQSRGAFDPTVGPLVDLWGFGPTASRDEVPSGDDIERLLKGVGYDKVSIDPEASSLIREAPVRLDFSAIAKGYAVDRLAELLVSLNFNDFLVEVGGEVRVAGTKPGRQPWRIAIETPSMQLGEVQRIISIQDVAVATSGDYRNYFEKNGERYSHTIDPRTGRPIRHNLASITVIAENTAIADGLATAMMVLGADESLKFAEQRDIPVFLLVKEGDVFVERYSRAFARYIEEGAFVKEIVEK